MKRTNTLALAISLSIAGTGAASAATISGSPALALAAVVAAHSPLLSPAEKRAVAAIFNGKGTNIPYKDKITVSADKIVCLAGNVDITARSCDVTFGKTESFTGREANELYATEAYAGVPSDGAAGKIYESLSKLKCTLDPKAIAQNDGSGADCSYEGAN